MVIVYYLDYMLQCIYYYLYYYYFITILKQSMEWMQLYKINVYQLQWISFTLSLGAQLTINSYFATSWIQLNPLK